MDNTVSIGEQLKAALKELEAACNELATTRSQQTYLSMIDTDHAGDALVRLDHARVKARELLK